MLRRMHAPLNLDPSVTSKRGVAQTVQHVDVIFISWFHRKAIGIFAYDGLLTCELTLA